MGLLRAVEYEGTHRWCVRPDDLDRFRGLELRSRWGDLRARLPRLLPSDPEGTNMARRNSKTTGNKRQREQDKLRKRRTKEERTVARKEAARDERARRAAAATGTEHDADGNRAEASGTEPEREQDRP